MSYDMTANPQQSTGIIGQTLTLRERLEMQKKYSAERLADINSAIEFLDKNPQFEAFHNLIGKTGF